MKTKLFLLLAFVFAWGHVQAQLCTSPPVEAPLFYSMSGNIVCGPQQSMFMLTNWPGAGFEVEWDFGDGMTSVQQSPMHMYTVPGNYTVTARYKNIGEACYSDYYTMVMTVYPPVPMPEFDFFTPMSCEGAPYELTLDAMSWPIGTCTLHVNFGDGTPPIERISSTPVTGIKHTYSSSPGSFPVSAFFSTMDGCVGPPYNFYMTIMDPIPAPPTIDPQYVCSGEFAYFSVPYQQLPSGTSVEWSGDGEDFMMMTEYHVEVYGYTPVWYRLVDYEIGCRSATVETFASMDENCGPPPDMIHSVYLSGQPGVSGYSDGQASNAQFKGLQGIHYHENSGLLFVADAQNHAIRQIDGIGVSTLAGHPSRVGYTNGSISTARFRQPSAVVANPDGSILYVADRGNHAIRKIDLNTSTVTTLSGTGGRGSALGSRPTYNNPSDLVLENDHLVVVDHGNNRIVKVDISTGHATLLAGSVTPGLTDGTGAAARFRQPWGIAKTGTGVLLVTDYGNHAIRRIESNGTVSSIAGIDGKAGYHDNNITRSELKYPTGIAANATRFFFTDQGNRVVRGCDDWTDGGVVIYTLSGSANPSNIGADTGGFSSYISPMGIAFDGITLFVTDAMSHFIRTLSFN